MKLTLLFVLLSSSYLINAQDFNSKGVIEEYCSADTNPKNRENILSVIDQIANYAGIARNFTVVECPNIKNAYAQNVKNEYGHIERYILYDLEFFNTVNARAETNWAAASIIAHEVGHHINGHSLNNFGSSHKFEFEADYFSGRILAFMGATLDEACAAIKSLKTEKATTTHPAKKDRLIQVAKGWKNAKGISTDISEEELKKKLAKSYFDKGLNALNEGNYERALNYLNTSSYEGMNEANYFLSKMYAEGLGVVIDQKKAYQLAEEGSNSGSVSCAYLLGYYLYSGIGCKTNRDAALSLWSRDYILDHFKKQEEETKNAFYTDELGMIYYSGLVTLQDLDKAESYFKKAVDKENVLGMYHLGGLYMDQYFPNANEDLAKSLFSLAADNQFAPALGTLGNFYCPEGTCNDSQRSKAEDYYLKALEQNYSESAYHLGELYFSDKNYEKARFYYRKAEDQYPYAKLGLGRVIFNSYSNMTPQQQTDGIRYYQEALDKNFIETYRVYSYICYYIDNGSLKPINLNPIYGSFYSDYRSYDEFYRSESFHYSNKSFRKTPDFVNNINHQLH